MAAGGNTTRGHLWTDADTARMVEMHGEGKSVQEIAQVIGCTKGTISKHADAEGLDWSRAGQTATAAHARSARAAEIRADNELAFAVESQTYLKKIHAPFLYKFTGGDCDMPEPYPVDQRAFAQMAMFFHKASQEIADRAAGRGIIDVTSMMARMGIALGVQTYVPTEDGDDDGSSAVGETDAVDP